MRFLRWLLRRAESSQLLLLGRVLQVCLILAYGDDRVRQLTNGHRSGAAAAAALKAEDYYETIRVFERRECAGGTWYADIAPGYRPHR